METPAVQAVFDPPELFHHLIQLLKLPIQRFPQVILQVIYCGRAKVRVPA